MVNEKNTKAYYDRVSAKTSQNVRNACFYIRQAEECKRLYILTKGRRGIYGFLHKWAKKGNEHFYKKGTKLALETLKICADNIEYLDNYLKSFEEEP